MSKNYFIFDENKCVGCEACVIACINENGFQEPETWRNVHSSNPLKFPGIPLFNLSMSCNHCEDAVCMENCPALAYSRSLLTGAIIHTADACIGCKYCTWNCPYDAPKYNPNLGIVSKCNFCEQLLAKNQKPACASLCPTGSLDFSFEEIDKSSIKSNINIPVSTQPSIVIKKRIKENATEIDHSLFEPIEITEPEVVKKISALKEWTLVLFTLIVSVMVAITTVDILNQQPLSIKLTFLSVGAIASGLSMFHLGKPFRAWRALLNIKKSWLSREILSFSLFYGFTFIDLIVIDLPNWLLILLGFVLLFSVDKLYQPAQVYWKTKLHSAQVIFIALSLFLLYSNFYWIFGSLMVVRLYLFLNRNKKFELPSTIGMIRILSIILTAVFIVIDFPVWYTILIFTIGEIIDRILFYNALDVSEIRRHLTQK